ncbi:MAG TPA: methylmalonyl-CoA mutase family protein [Chloroflexota bacterium]|jgi:methylmalonyl-CoA mutase N-terminal domain/subunit
MSEFEPAKHDWEARAVGPALKRMPERQLAFTTASGIEVERLYGPEERDYCRSLGFPGEPPFTRGVQPTMYRGRLWTMRQYSGYSTAEESNRRFRYLLEQGQSGISVAFDLPTQIGYDADAPEAEGEVGKVGVSISSLLDMEELLQEIPLDRVTTSMTINATASVLLAFYVAAAKRRGVPPEELGGTLQNDILKEYIARGTYIYPPGPSMRLTVDVIEWCTEHAPKWNPISISGYHIREAGSTAVQEIAFTLSNGLAYVEAARARGLDVDSFAPRLSFFFNAHSDFFEEIAKYRAARRLWARLMAERTGTSDPRSLALRFHVQTAGSTLTAQQPDVNVVRTTLQALAAVLGGCQSLHTNAMDEALALPTEPAARLALRTQQVIAHETGVASTVDPIGGSYYVESLTDELERRSLELIAEVDRQGGALSAVERGFQSGEIHRAAYEWERRLNEGGVTVVGVNAYVEPGRARPETLRVDEAVAGRQRERLAGLRRERDGSIVERALAELEDAARGSTNLVDPIIAAVEAYGTMGEICGVLRRVFGEYRPSFGL